MGSGVTSLILRVMRISLLLLLYLGPEGLEPST